MLSFVLPDSTADHAADPEADDCQKEEQGMHAEGYEQHQGQDNWPKAASSGFNSARDLFLQQQSNKKEDTADRGEAANPFARSKSQVADPAAAYAHIVIRLHDIGVLEEVLTHCLHIACKPVSEKSLPVIRAGRLAFAIWQRVSFLSVDRLLAPMCDASL